jgi:hypothetical protein
VGTSAAILRDEGSSISTALTPAILRQIQQALLRDDVFLPGMPGHDKMDLVQDATIRASSEGVKGSALTIRNGYTREIRDEWGTWAKASPNCWEGTEFPAWIDLEWSEAQNIAKIHLTFCTGLERELTLSPHDRLTSFTIRGPQPETIRDYNLILDGNLLLEVRNNYLRKREHLFPSSVKGRRLRVELLSSHGFPSPRIFEIRAYDKKGCSNV